MLGGGLVPGSAVLVGGDPGIGKSTLLLQAPPPSRGRPRAVYVSGEEAAAQVRLRAARLGLAAAPVRWRRDQSARHPHHARRGAPGPRGHRLDPDHVGRSRRGRARLGRQVRAVAHELTALPSAAGIAVVMVGHVTKDGQIAGPRVVEHMVDTVLYFEGERAHQFRILRAVKNRYGPADEIGVFEMTGQGLAEVANPSALFLGERGAPASGLGGVRRDRGDAAGAGRVPGAGRALPLGTPRRAVIGWDAGGWRWCWRC